MGEIPSLDYTTPDMDDVIREFIEIDRLELNTCMPAIVKQYDSATQLCDVQPCMKRTSIDGEIRSRAVLKDVPVMFPRSGSAGVHFPINVDDSVLIVFSQRSLDEWSDKGGQVVLLDDRLHNVTDAIVIAGLHPLSDPISPVPKTDATELRGEKIFIGDPSKNTAAIPPISAGAGLASDTGGTAPLTFTPEPLDLLTVIERFLIIMENCHYGGGGPNLGGGPIDATSGPALKKLLEDIATLKVV